MYHRRTSSFIKKARVLEWSSKLKRLASLRVPDIQYSDACIFFWMIPAREKNKNINRGRIWCEFGQKNASTN